MVQGAAARVRDLKQRGLLSETMVVWGGEFGRTPMSESGNGRDHNPYGFTMWLAGGGLKGGVTYGSTDEIGLYAVDNPVHVHDLHATMLHCLGLDHKKLTYLYNGRNERATINGGRVVTDLLGQGRNSGAGIETTAAKRRCVPGDPDNDSIIQKPCFTAKADFRA